MLSAFNMYCKLNYLKSIKQFTVTVIYNTAPTAAPKISLYRRLLGLNPGLLRLRHWQSDALTNRLDLIHKTRAACAAATIILLRNNLTRESRICYAANKMTLQVLNANVICFFREA
jgi:hypothetical protein